MDIRCAIHEYKRISPDIFKSSLLSYVGGNAVKALVGKPWFKGETLEKEVKRIVKEFLPDGENATLIPKATLLPTEEMQAGVCKMYEWIIQASFVRC
jgi:hypothetical protein